MSDSDIKEIRNAMRMYMAPGIAPNMFAFLLMMQLIGVLKRDWRLVINGADNSKWEWDDSKSWLDK